MRVHRNAKTTPKMRQLIVHAAPSRAGRYARIAAALGHERADGREVGRARRGRTTPRGWVVAPASAAAPLAARSRPPSWRCDGPARRPGRSAPRCGMPRSTVTRVLARAGLNRVALPRAARRRCSAMNGRTSAICCTSISSGSAAWPGLAIASMGTAADARAAVGWEYLHVAIDDATRLTYAEVLAAADAPTCAAFLQRTLRVVSPAGHPHPPAAHRQRDGLSRRRLRRRRVSAGRCGTASPGRTGRRPTAKPSASFKRCCASGRTACPIAARPAGRRRSRPYLRFYNHRRPHASLGRRSPWMRFQEAA